MINLKEIATGMASVAREAGSFIRTEAVNFDIGLKETKGLNNFVSYVDKGAEEIIVRRLSILIPEAGFRTEEGTAEISGTRYSWVVDPLDGTTNFLHGLPPYAVSIGLQDYDEIIAGVVYEITADEMFMAWKNGGAWLNGKKIRVSAALKLSESLVATGFPYSDFSHLGKYIDCFQWFLKNTHGVRRLGSAATDIVYIACGRFEAFYEYGLYPWDVVAATIILREAGGRVSDFNGNEKSVTGEEIIAASANIFQEILKIVNKFMKN